MEGEIISVMRANKNQYNGYLKKVSNSYAYMYIFPETQYYLLDVNHSYIYIH